ncbi:flagellar transcriptional regulator FlhD [Burkholderia gladioli]|uniref:flagellar transcriptional regulator FlhD n=1 Tax=Burkholderia gladioli TaxID=28095 RepID=UPI001E5FC766|nr:flagellar transcriptional regulator FlhD [Burkholderia gladioli]
MTPIACHRLGHSIQDGQTGAACKVAVGSGAIMNGQGDIVDAITAFNRAYLLLAQRILRADREQGKRQLGVTDEVAAWIVAMTPEQIDEHAASTELCCEIRVENIPGRG